MDFELTDDQAMLREVSRTMLVAHCPRTLVRSLSDAGTDVDEKLWQRGVELGWIGLGVGEDHGGSAQGVVELCLVAEELGRALAPGPVAESALVALLLSRADSEPLAEIASALSEGQARAGLAHHGSVAAIRDGDAVVLDGDVTATQAAASVDWLLVSVTITDGGPALVLVEAKHANSRRRNSLDVTRGWYDVTFRDVRVPAARVVTTNTGQMQWADDAATLLVCADALGVGDRLLEMTVEHALVREQFGRPLGRFQSVKHKVADMLGLVRGARAATYYAAMALDAGAADSSLAVSVAKAYTGEGMSTVAGEALQTLGGLGFTWEHDLHLYLRRAKTDEGLYGQPTEHHERVLSLIVADRAARS